MHSVIVALPRIWFRIAVALVALAQGVRADESTDAHDLYLQWVGRARAAQAIEMRCTITAKRPVAGVFRTIESSIEASIAKDGERRFGRYLRRAPLVPGADPADDGSLIVLADGDFAFALDETRQAYVRNWPPRFVASGEGRSFLLFRAFLGDAIEEPVRVTFTKGTEPTESTLELEFQQRAESLHFDSDGKLVRVTKRDRAGAGTKTEFRFERFELIEKANPYDFSCRPLGSFRDVTVATAKQSPITARNAPNAPPEGPARGVLKEGDRDVDASFLTTDNALIRLANVRGRKIVIAFLDSRSPSANKDRLVLERTSRRAERGDGPPLFLVIESSASDGKPVAPIATTATLQRVKPARSELERVFGVLLPPTTVILDEAGTVIQRSAVVLDENRLRKVLGLD